MDWTATRTALRSATLAAVDELLPALRGERLYAICLQTDDGGMGVGLCANTEECYAEKCADAEPSDRSEEYFAYLRWDSAEWRHELFGWEHFGKADEQLAAGLDDADPAFAPFFDQLIEAMTDALANLRVERASALEHVTLFVTITDSDETLAVEDRSAQRLNPPQLAEPFLRRYG
jgi:hypothetical protein